MFEEIVGSSAALQATLTNNLLTLQELEVHRD